MGAKHAADSREDRPKRRNYEERQEQSTMRNKKPKQKNIKG